LLNPCLQAVHQRLYGKYDHAGNKLQRIDVVLYGPGKVGQAVLNRIAEQHWLARLEHRLDIQLRAVVNSQHATLIDEQHQSTTMTSHALWQQLSAKKNNGNRFTIIIDTTSANQIAQQHANWLQQGYAVITANKLSLSSDDKSYQQLQAHPLFAGSATVGAGLPIITALQNLQVAGQTPSSFTAVLSGSINFLLEQLQLRPDYLQALTKAQQLGLVEPDPKADLSGLDTARKSLILARLLGDNLSLSDVNYQPLPVAKQLEQSSIIATNNGQRLAYIVEWQPGHINIRLQTISADSCLAVNGVHNMIRINSNNDQEHMIIAGPGAGINITADAVYRDLILVANRASLMKSQVSKAA